MCVLWHCCVCVSGMCGVSWAVCFCGITSHQFNENAQIRELQAIPMATMAILLRRLEKKS